MIRESTRSVASSSPVLKQMTLDELTKSECVDREKSAKKGSINLLRSHDLELVSDTHVSLSLPKVDSMQIEENQLTKTTSQTLETVLENITKRSSNPLSPSTTKERRGS